MKISYNWLKEFVDLKKYPVPKLVDLLTMNFAEVDGVEEVNADDILDLKILPDRASDCLSHYGVAREIAALSKLKVKSLKFKVKESKKEKIENILKVENQNPEICKRYVSRVIKNVKIEPSPKWLKERLEALGQKSINNVVDATNYVMLEFGQPFHVFDLNKIESVQVQSSKLKVKSESQNLKQIPKIIIRRAKKGEKISTLDNQEVELSEDVLVIADNKDSLAIAGVKGGRKAEIDQNTKNIVLESANFIAQSVRKSSRLNGIKTESSTRFAADLDPNLAGEAMERLASLIVEIARGEIVSGKIDIYPRPVKEYKLGFSLEDANKLLGIELSEKEVLDILKRLNFKVKKVSPLKEVLKLAQKLKGKPYKYGASVSFDAPNAFDCSSFTNYLFLQSGIQMPRMAIDQYFYSEPIAEKDAKPGDLVFSSSGKGKIYYESQEFMRGLKIKEGIDHVGIYLGRGKVIYATRLAGKVIIDDLKKSKSFKNFRGFRRIKDIERENIFVVDVPTYRRDIGPKGIFVLQKDDIIEEIGRIYGYQNLKSKLPESVLIPPKRNDELFWEDAAKNAMISAGFAEAYNYSFIGRRDLQNALIDEKNILQLENPSSDDKKYLRPSLAFGFLKNIRDNFRYFNNVMIFEVGKIFSVQNNKISEIKHLGGIVGVKGGKIDKVPEFYEAKAAIDLLIGKLGIPEVWYADYVEPRSFLAERDDYNIQIESIYHPLRVAEIKIGDEKIGIVGEINRKVLDAYDISGHAAIFEIDFEKLAKIADEDYIYRPISKYPAVERDLAILVPLNIKVDDILSVLENVGGRLLVDTDLFDIYEGDNISEGMKSLAFHLIFQSQDKTLSDKEIDDIMSKIISALGEQGWEIRK